MIKPFTQSLLLIPLLLTACNSSEIKQYRVAKTASTTTANTVSAKAVAKDIAFKTPKGWQAQPASGMRKASFKTDNGGDMSVVSLPAQSGDLKSNVNRWRGQVGLAPFTDDAQISKSVTPVKIDGTPAIELELYAPEGKEDKAMRVVLLQKNGQRWFLKLSGTRSIVKAQAEPFQEFTRSFQVKSAASEATPEAPPMTSPSQLPFAKPTSTLAYTLPKTWQEKEKGAVRLASFEVKDKNLTGDVSVVTLAGDGGGLLENTNRWRRQLEMAPTSQEGLKNSVKDITVDGSKGYFMALYTNLDGSGMLVALVEREGVTWFIKMMGPAALIQSQEQPFQAFLNSIKFKGAAS